MTTKYNVNDNVLWFNYSTILTGYIDSITIENDSKVTYNIKSIGDYCENVPESFVFASKNEAIIFIEFIRKKRIEETNELCENLSKNLNTLYLKK